MNWSVKLGILVSVIFLIYSIVCYIRKDVFFTINSDRFLIINDKYFGLQFQINIISFICLMGLSFINRYSKLNIMYILYFNLIFWISNYILKKIAILKKYAKLVLK